jgi:hypothetical protein
MTTMNRGAWWLGVAVLAVAWVSCGESTEVGDFGPEVETAFLELGGGDDCLSVIKQFNTYGAVEGRTESGRVSASAWNFSGGFINGLSFRPDAAAFVDDRLVASFQSAGCVVTPMMDEDEPGYLDRIKDTSWNQITCAGVVSTGLPAGLLVLVGDHKVAGSGQGAGDAVVNAAAYLYGYGQTNNDRLNTCRWFCPRTVADPCWVE